MEDINKVIKSVKESVTVDNIISLMKEAKVIDTNRLSEEDVRKTLSKMDIKKYVDIEEIKKHAKNVADQSKDTIKDIQEQSSKVLTYAKDSLKDFSVFKVLNKSDCDSPGSHPIEATGKQEYDCSSDHTVGNEVETREEDACKAESQGKQYDPASNQGRDNNTLEVSPIENLNKNEAYKQTGR